VARWILTLASAGAAIASTVLAQVPPGPPRSGPVPVPGVPQGPPPTHADIEYAPADPPTSNGHKLDLYLPASPAGPLPVVLWTSGSAWMADTGKRGAGRLAERLNPAGYAVAGVSIRSSAQVRFPGQLHDIKAAIRWLRANAATYDLDPDRVGIMGDSSGGWTAAMAAVTGDAPELEGSVGTTGLSSAVQAAIAFYPPTDFLTMDAWALQRCDGPRCHDAQGSPESRLLGCAIQTCPDKVLAANPARYVSPGDPPLMILHGDSDALVPHNQGERLYMALNKACRDAVFISLPRAPHGNWVGFLTDAALREAATIRSTVADGCRVTNPTPYTPTWKTVIDFLDGALKPGPAQRGGSGLGGRSRARAAS
jgi:acetyl esterase/lipase